MGSLINHLQRLPLLFPDPPWHNPDTPNLSWSHVRQKAKRRTLLENSTFLGVMLIRSAPCLAPYDGSRGMNVTELCHLTDRVRDL